MEENKKYEEYKRDRERLIAERAALSEELNSEHLYTIKNKCFICGIKIKNCFTYFQKYGNSCVSCSGSCSRIAKLAGNTLAIGYEREAIKKRSEDVILGIIKEQDANYFVERFDKQI